MPLPIVAALALALLQPVAPAPAPEPPPPAQPEHPAAAPPAPPMQPPQPYPQPAQPPQPYAQPAPPAPQAQPPQPHAQPVPPQVPAAPPYTDQPYPPQPGYPAAPPPAPYDPDPPPLSAAPPDMSEGPAALPESVSHRKLVFAGLVNLNFSVLFPVPSGDFSFFLGTDLRPRKNFARTFDWNTALGYQLTLSVGGADIMTFSFSNLDVFGLFIHRHHLTAMGYGGKRQRLFYSLGGGAIFNFTEVVGVEGEARLGYVFSRPERRVKGIVGGQARLTAAFDGAPLPQFGLFLGFMAF